MKKTLLSLLLLVALTCLGGTNEELSELKSDVAATKTEVRLLQTRLTELLQLRDKEIALASESVDKRLAQMNEFRAQLDRQAGTFVTKEAYDTMRQNIEKQVQETKLWQANMDGKLLILGAGLMVFFSIFNGVALVLIRRVHHHSSK